MHRFWSTVIEPVLEAAKARVIVEIGADRGANTANILRYCVQRGAVAHVIDPLPKFSVEEWQQEYGAAFVFHRMVSLDALPSIPAMDVVMIDGDHNWYTVFHELKAIEGVAGGAEQFPVVLLHDVEWPYGRRDLYYDPESIPAAYRHPFKRLGIRPATSQLVPARGFNTGAANAVDENTARNGVRTALEDFIAESPLEFQVSTIPGLHGLGILSPAAVIDGNRRLADVISSFETREFLARQCDEIERSRIGELITAHDKRKRLKRRIRELERELAESGERAKGTSGRSRSMHGQGGDDVTDETGTRLRVVEPYADREQPEGPERLYLELMKQCLTRYIFGDTSLGRRRDKPLKASIRAEGLDWPAEAETMIGLRRLDSLEECITDVLDRGVAGDVVETGVWRGGAAIFMRAVLKAYGDTTRTVWAADSFQGLPKPDAEAYPADEGDRHWKKEELAVSLEQVKANFSRYGLLDEQVRFLVGWFRDTLPTAPIERLAVLRLDGDMYESTIVALRALYPKVSIGGYVIVDDYGAVAGCRKAVDDFREEHAITDEIRQIDWSGVFWQRSS